MLNYLFGLIILSQAAPTLEERLIKYADANASAVLDRFAKDEGVQIIVVPNWREELNANILELNKGIKEGAVQAYADYWATQRFRAYAGKYFQKGETIPGWPDRVYQDVAVLMVERGAPMETNLHLIAHHFSSPLQKEMASNLQTLFDELNSAKAEWATFEKSPDFQSKPSKKRGIQMRLAHAQLEYYQKRIAFIRENLEWRIDAHLLERAAQYFLGAGDLKNLHSRLERRILILEEDFEALSAHPELKNVSREDFRAELNCRALDALWESWQKSSNETSEWIDSQKKFLAKTKDQNKK